MSCYMTLYGEQICGHEGAKNAGARDFCVRSNHRNTHDAGSAYVGLLPDLDAVLAGRGRRLQFPRPDRLHFLFNPRGTPPLVDGHVSLPVLREGEQCASRWVLRLSVLS